MDPEWERWVGMDELIIERTLYLKTWKQQRSWHILKPEISSLCLETLQFNKTLGHFSSGYRTGNYNWSLVMTCDL